MTICTPMHVAGSSPGENNSPAESQQLYVGVDDTDNETSIGTGRLARNLSQALGQHGLGIPEGVTRHQLLVDPRIPYTSHNSAAAIVIGGARRDDVAQFCREFLRDNFHTGADPGLCVAWGPEAALLTGFGALAQREVVDMESAYALARATGCLLEEHGGTGQGIIGALAAVGLRAGKTDGRFLDMGKCRMIEGILTVDELLEESGADAVQGPEGDLPESERVDTQSWVRPELIDGRTVILVERHGTRWRTYRPSKTAQ